MAVQMLGMNVLPGYKVRMIDGETSMCTSFLQKIMHHVKYTGLGVFEMNL